MVVDGKIIAESVYAAIGTKLRGKRLGIVVSTGDVVTDSYVRIKARAAERLGVEIVRRELSPDATTADALAAVASLVEVADGIIVQLPLPPQADADTVLAAVPPERDVDALNTGAFVTAPVAGAVREILKTADIDAAGKRAVVIGQGRLVGVPCAALLRELGADVMVVTRGDSLEPLHDADIVVSGAGVPGLIKPDMIRNGVVLIDAGTSESSGKVAGDADSACAEKASVFTPVPGGVGPLAIAMIFKNLFDLMQEKDSPTK
jgi:methylenetetrahydrofolate dehydrogenase (NADP+)/methenyltetrahydrofolate cyclohydrolase